MGITVDYERITGNNDAQSGVSWGYTLGVDEKRRNGENS